MIQTYNHYFLSSATTFEEATGLLIPKTPQSPWWFTTSVAIKFWCCELKNLIKLCEIIHDIRQMWDFIWSKWVLLEASTIENTNLVDCPQIYGECGLNFQGIELGGFEAHQQADVWLWWISIMMGMGWGCWGLYFLGDVQRRRILKTTTQTRFDC